jgi:NAD(P)-dependent dehydrogenase (short-subunit alcohol dehydrogenase family)
MNHYPNFKDKVALVTGASSGMGLAAAQAFAEAGPTRRPLMPRMNILNAAEREAFDSSPARERYGFARKTAGCCSLASPTTKWLR